MLTGEEKKTAPPVAPPGGFSLGGIMSMIPVSAWIAVAGILAAVWYSRKDSSE